MAILRQVGFHLDGELDELLRIELEPANQLVGVVIAAGVGPGRDTGRRPVALTHRADDAAGEAVGRSTVVVPLVAFRQRILDGLERRRVARCRRGAGADLPGIHEPARAAHTIGRSIHDVSNWVYREQTVVSACAQDARAVTV